jgi:hypothetical protein
MPIGELPLISRRYVLRVSRLPWNLPLPDWV